MHTLAIILAVWPLTAFIVGAPIGLAIKLGAYPSQNARRDLGDVQGLAHGHLSTSQAQ